MVELDIQVIHWRLELIELDGQTEAAALAAGLGLAADDSLVCRFHQSRTAASQHVDSLAAERMPELLGERECRIVRLDSGAPKDTDPEVVVGQLGKLRRDEHFSLTNGLEPLLQPAPTRFSMLFH